LLLLLLLLPQQLLPLHAGICIWLAANESGSAIFTFDLLLLLLLLHCCCLQALLTG
jgi:hypothetical protein